MSAKMIAITGGPCAGKTTLMARLEQEFGSKIASMPEAATTLLSNRFPHPAQFADPAPILRHLQDAILPLQRSMEEAYRLLALQQKLRVILGDRGLLDGAAYVPGGLPVFVKAYGLDLQEVYARYDMVIHLESVAVHHPKAYERLKKNNPARQESLREAQLLEHRTRGVWAGHPNRVIVSGKHGIDDMFGQLVHILSPHIDTEIERKFWLPSMPNLPKKYPSKPILQGYLILNKLFELRVRRIGHQAFITIKGSGKLDRPEWERPLPLMFFQLLWEATKRVGRIYKRRYYIPHDDGLTLEIDVYQRQLAGLVTLECEIPTKDYPLVLPRYIQGEREITDNDYYKNKNLAVYGLPT